MAQSFVRGDTQPGGRDGTPFNNAFNRFDAAGRVNEARVVAPHSKFEPDTRAQQGSGDIATPGGAVRLDNKTVQQGARPAIAGAGKQTGDAQKKESGEPLPPGPRAAALRARGLSPTAPGEAFSRASSEVTLGGRPVGGQVGYTGHAAPERPLAHSLPRRAPTNLPPPGRA